MSVVSMKQLLEAGVHFGHQTRRWNPKMEQYIYMERNGIYIIDLQKTVKKLEEAYNFVREISENGGSLLFVGTKKQAQDAVKEEAERVGMFFVNARWLGGMLTNFKTMRMRIDRLAQLRQMQDDGTFDILPKKEVIRLTGEINRLEKYLGGVKDMKKLPAALFIVDPRKEHNAIAEARKLGIPIVAIVDTNCDPDEINYVIPGNDDAIRAIRLIAQAMANAVIEGRQGMDSAVASTPESSEGDAPVPVDIPPVAAPQAVAPVEAALAPAAPKNVVEKVEDKPVVEKKAPAKEPVVKAEKAPAVEAVEDKPIEEKPAEEAPVKKTVKKATKKSEDTPTEAKVEKAAEEKPAEEAPVKKTVRKTTKKAEDATADVKAEKAAKEKPAEEAPVKKTVRKTTKKAEDATAEAKTEKAAKEKPAAKTPAKKTAAKTTKKAEDTTAE